MVSKVSSYFRNKKRNTEDSGSDYGQFQRSSNSKDDNYKLKLSDLDIIPMKLLLDDKGKMTFNKNGQVKRVRKSYKK